MWKFYLVGSVAAATVGSSSYALPNYGTGRECPLVRCVNLDCPPEQQQTPRDANGCLGCPRCTGGVSAPTPRVGGKGKGGSPYGCPMVMCAEPGYCPTALETPTVNGCPSCPRCPCTCGESCTMFGGGSGVCQTDGACAVNIQAPQCNRGCETVRCTSSTTCILGKCVPHGGVLCTQEVQTCPDGSFVGREPPSCAFKPCPTAGSGGVVCTLEARTCPDGSSVGRTGPNCEFAPCPTRGGKGCTREVRPCPDGSSVGRTGPNCEFAPCPNQGSGGVVCTLEVRICPDGSSVGRTGPNCEFAPCPSTGSCICGATCTNARGVQGVCQANGNCNTNANRRPPVCGGSNAASCATLLCLTGTTCQNGQCVPNF